MGTIRVSLDRKTMQPMRELTPEEKQAFAASLFAAASALEDARRRAAMIAAGKDGKHEKQ